MNQLKEIMQIHPGRTETEMGLLARCVQECFDCSQTCVACADACLAEDNVAELVNCIQLNLTCADICETTGRVVSRQTGSDWNLLRKQIEACWTACELCAQECEKHVHHEHCRMCAHSCRSCASACEQLMQSRSGRK